MILLGASNFPVTRSNFAMHFRKCENFREREREREREERNEKRWKCIFFFVEFRFFFAGNKVNNVIFL